MDYYTNAQDTEQAATVLLDGGSYRQSVYMSFLAIELYLKSKLHLVKYREGLELSHDIVNLYRALLTHYQPKSDMNTMVVTCRKYFNESRYPYANDTSVYTKKFAKEFIGYVMLIKDYIDNECIATMDDLKDKYQS